MPEGSRMLAYQRRPGERMRGDRVTVAVTGACNGYIFRKASICSLAIGPKLRGLPEMGFTLRTKRIANSAAAQPDRGHAISA